MCLCVSDREKECVCERERERESASPQCLTSIISLFHSLFFSLTQEKVEKLMVPRNLPGDLFLPSSVKGGSPFSARSDRPVLCEQPDSSLSDRRFILHFRDRKS